MKFFRTTMPNVIPAQLRKPAGIHFYVTWIPAFAGTTIVLIALLTSMQVTAAAIPKLKQFMASNANGSAAFEQSVLDKTNKVTQRAKGMFLFSRPGKFRWTYEKPAQIIVGDGAKVWIYDQDLNQVTVRKLDQALSSTPAALLTSNNKIESLFDLREAGIQNDMDWLEAKPKSADTGFERFRIGFAGETLAAMELYDQFGSHTLLLFTHLKHNSSVNPAQFKFVPPKDADVIGDEK